MQQYFQLLVSSIVLAMAFASMPGCANRAAALAREPADPEAVAEAIAARDYSRRPYASSRAYRHYARGMLDMHEGRLSRAKKEFREALLYDRDSSEIRIALLEVQLRLGKKDLAVDGAEALLADEPEHRRALLLVALFASDNDGAEVAIQALKGLLDAPSSSLEEYFRLSRLLVEQAGDTNALVIYRVLGWVNSLEASHWTQLASMLETNGLKDEARVAWENAIEANDGDAALYDSLGRICDALKDVECSIKAYRRAIALGGATSGSYLELASVLGRAGKLEEALRVEEEAIALLDPAQPETWVEAAFAAVARRDLDTALARFDEALRLDSEHMQAHLFRGFVLGELGRWQKAADSMRSVCRNTAYYFEARLHLGIFLSRAGEHEEALEILSALLGGRPEDPRLVVALASAEARAGKEEEGIGRLMEGIAASPGEALLVEEVSRIHTRAGRLEEAADALAEAVRTRPLDARLRYSYGVALEELGRTEEAVAEMKKILEFRPEHVDALNFIGYVWADRGVRLEEAENLLRLALSLDRNNAYVMDSLGWVLFRKGKIDEALPKLERAASLLDDQPIVWEHLGDAYAAAGRSEDAKASYEKALELLDELERDQDEPRDRLLEKLKELE